MTDSEKIPLNQILYGPPGTGKTYSTINKALEILQSYEEITEIPEDRQEQKERFDEFMASGQIEFVTFHQSYSYEEFVEGIKPDLDSQSAESNDMHYVIKDGIFKKLCQKALKNYQDSQKTPEQIKKDVEFDKLLEEYANYLEEQLQREGKISFKGTMNIIGIHRLKNGDFQSVIIAYEASGHKRYLSKRIIEQYYEKYEKGEIKSHRDITSDENKTGILSQAEFYFELLKQISEFENNEYQELESKNFQTEPIIEQKLKPYILIIDEINRGNIAKILGELITLIEPSKRIGTDEGLQLTLPYSGEFFGVPSNLYIIGTMNTADRSIALLDTALRRRFEFVEMMPKPELLGKCGDVDLQEMLDSMNNRIEFLLDREHTIGHSYFMGVESIEDLCAVFKNKIIPLLQEYFYDDYAKIIAVLNDNGMIEEKKADTELLKVALDKDLVDSGKVVYRITESSEWQARQFVAIYNESEANKLKEKQKDSKNSESNTTNSDNAQS